MQKLRRGADTEEHGLKQIVLIARLVIRFKKLMCITIRRLIGNRIPQRIDSELLNCSIYFRQSDGFSIPPGNPVGGEGMNGFAVC